MEMKIIQGVFLWHIKSQMPALIAGFAKGNARWKLSVKKMAPGGSTPTFAQAAAYAPMSVLKRPLKPADRAEIYTYKAV